MKKLLAVILSLCLLLTSVVAFAETEATEILEINWADVEPAIIEAGWEGEFALIEQVSAAIWLPVALLPTELTEEDIANGYIAHYTTEDMTAAMSALYVEMGTTHEDYMAALAQIEGVAEISEAIVNGIRVINYTMPEGDAGIMAVVTDLGNVLEFAFSPISDEAFASVASVIMASLQIVEVETAAE